MGNKHEFEDDGRTVASMDGVGRTHGFEALDRLKEFGNQKKMRDMEPVTRPDIPQDELSGEERRWYIFGAIRAGLMIGAAYVVGLGALIVFLLWVWGVL